MSAFVRLSFDYPIQKQHLIVQYEILLYRQEVGVVEHLKIHWLVVFCQNHVYLHYRENLIYSLKNQKS